MKILSGFKKVTVFCLILLVVVSTPPVVAGPETQIVISDAAFEVSEGFDFNLGIPDHLTEPRDRKFYMLVREKNSDFHLRRLFENELFKLEYKPENRVLFDAQLASFTQRFPQLLKGHLEQTLKEFPHTGQNVEGGRILTIPQGLEFWIRLVSHPNPEKKVAGLIFLARPFADDLSGLPGRLVELLTDTHSPKTQILRSDQFTEKEMQILIQFAQTKEFSVSKHGNYVLIGKGQSFDLFRELFFEAKKLVDPVLQTKFVRVLNFLSSQGISVEMDENQGAAAYFALGQKRIAFVMPSRIDLDTLTHEATHGRFDRFLETFGKWIRGKNYAVPYEVDGPSNAIFSNFGGYMSLLNELNSWRVGSSFSDKLTDEEILKILEESYGRQAGFKAANDFDNLWPASRVENKSVPSLIVEATRSLNEMSNSQVLDYGKRSLTTQDEMGQHNFLRLVLARFKPDMIPDDLLEVVAAFQHQGSIKRVRDLAQRVFERRLPKFDSPAKEPLDAVAIVPQQFDALWKEFLNEPTSEINDALVESHSRHFRAEHLRKLFALAFDDEQQGDHRTQAFKLLEALFEKLGFDCIYEPSEYSGMVALQQSMNRTNNRPLDADLPVSRPSNPTHWLFNTQTDALIAEKMFNGRPGAYRLDLINFITSHTYPGELPLLGRRLVDVISRDGALLDKNDFWVARMFLVPAKSIMYKTHLVWGEFVANAVMNDQSPQPTALEFVAEFYRLAVSKVLPLRVTRVSMTGRLDETVRRDFKASLRKATSRQKFLLKKGTQTLWQLLGNESVQIRRAARYAIASHPGFLLELESSLIKSLKGSNAIYRTEAISLISYVKPGFFSKIDRVLDDPTMTLTPEEKAILSLRRSPQSQVSNCSESLFQVVIELPKRKII